MAWVRSEYAGELAVLSAWLSMVLPWNVVYHTSVPTEVIRSELVAARFSLLEFQFRFAGQVNLEGEEAYNATESFATLISGSQVAGDLYATTPVGAMGHYEGYMQLGSVAWAVGAAALLVAFAVSIGLYFREERFEARSPVDPVRLVGLLLGAATVATAVASALYFLDRGLAGIPIPVGVVVMGALSVALLRVERR